MICLHRRVSDARHPYCVCNAEAAENKVRVSLSRPWGHIIVANLFVEKIGGCETPQKAEERFELETSTNAENYLKIISKP